MSCQASPCSPSARNTGYSCQALFEEAFKIILVPTFDSDGNKNRILFTHTLNDAYFSALINNADPTKRWYPTPPIDNPETSRAEPSVWESSTKKKIIIQQSSRTFKGLMTEGAYPQIEGKLNSFRDLQKVSGWIVSTTGQLQGKKSEDGLGLEPFRLSAQSINAIFNYKSTVSSTPQHIAFSFDYELVEKDSDIRQFDCSELGGASLVDLSGLLDVTATYSDITVDGFTMTLTTEFGDVTSPVMVTGVTNQDFYSDDDNPGYIQNVTTVDNVGVSVTEGEDGVYAVEYQVAVALGDVLFPEIRKNGYDFTGLDNVYTPTT